MIEQSAAYPNGIITPAELREWQALDAINPRGDRIYTTINLRKRPWVGPVLLALAYSCAGISLVSDRLAAAVSRIAITKIVRWGFVVETDSSPGG